MPKDYITNILRVQQILKDENLELIISRRQFNAAANIIENAADSLYRRARIIRSLGVPELHFPPEKDKKKE